MSASEVLGDEDFAIEINFNGEAKTKALRENFQDERSFIVGGVANRGGVYKPTKYSYTCKIKYLLANDAGAATENTRLSVTLEKNLHELDHP